MNDANKKALIGNLRHLIETATTTLSHVALGQEQAAAAMLSVSAMYLADSVGTMTGSDKARAAIHMAAYGALDASHPDRNERCEAEIAEVAP